MAGSDSIIVADQLSLHAGARSIELLGHRDITSGKELAHFADGAAARRLKVDVPGDRVRKTTVKQDLQPNLLRRLAGLASQRRDVNRLGGCT